MHLLSAGITILLFPCGTTFMLSALLFKLSGLETRLKHQANLSPHPSAHQRGIGHTGVTMNTLDLSKPSMGVEGGEEDHVRPTEALADAASLHHPLPLQVTAGDWRKELDAVVQV